MGVRKVAGAGKYRKSEKPWYKKKYSVKDMALKAWKGVKMMRGIINSEKKHHLTNSSGQNIDYNGTVVQLSDISQGDTISTRSGNSILAKSLYYNYNIGAVAAGTNIFCRVMVIQDTMNLGSAPAPGDVLTTVGAIHAPSSTLQITYAAQRRFKVLYDHMHRFSNGGSISGGDMGVIKLGNTHIKYTSTTGTDEGRNQLYVLFISNLVTTNLPNINFHFSLTYYDN